LLGFWSLLSVNAVGQNSVVVTSKKITMKKLEAGVSGFHKTIEIDYPEVASDDAPLDKIRESLSYWSNYGTTLDEIRQDQFTSGLTFKVNYNGKGVLDVTLIHSGSTAYPSDFEEHVVIDLESGEKIEIRSAFQNRTDLYHLIAKAHQAEKAAAIEENEEARQWMSDTALYFSIYEIEDFTVSDKGVTFLFDYEFAHVMKAAEPEGKYFFSWETLKPFVVEYGPLANFLETN